VALTGDRTFVGIGFGAIQAGLFLYEAFRSGSFRRLVVSEVVPELVAAVQRSGGHYRLNIAHQDRIEPVEIGPVEICDPSTPESRELLAEAIAEAEEIATAVPSVGFYVSDRPGSIHRLLAEGLSRKATRRGPRSVVYAAENHNHAAEILREKVLADIPREGQPRVDAHVRFLNTVIGKMSGVVSDPAQVKLQKLETVTRDDRRAFLVEVFNRILISRIEFDDDADQFRRGIQVFQEKDDLLPFEEAKLFGHNATHALAAYLAMIAGIPFIADLRQTPVLPFLEQAFIEESGGALVRKYNGIDPLFTEPGYRLYVLDLLDRMTNPFLRDTAERVGRDPARKLGWDDRLIGTIRLALGQGVEPRRYALGAAAALTTMQPSLLDRPDASPDPILQNVWGSGRPDGQEARRVVESISRAFPALRRWKAAGCAGVPFQCEER